MMDDTAICFQCGLALDGWEEGDDPHHEHSRRRPDCPFVKKGIALHPCSFEFLLGSKPDTNAIRHISSSSTAAVKDGSTGKFKLPPPRRETKKVDDSQEARRTEGFEKPKVIKDDEASDIRKNVALPGTRRSIVSKRSPKDSTTHKAKVSNGLGPSTTAHPSLAVTVATPRESRQSIRRVTAASTKTPSAAPPSIPTTKDTGKPIRPDLYDKENEPPTASKRRRITMAKPMEIDDETATLLGVTMEQASTMTVGDYIAMLQVRKLEEFDTQAKEILAKFSKSAYM